MMMVSVVVPTYNGSQCIARCLDALANQDFPQPYEIIVVDDGSTDNTEVIVKKYSTIKYIAQVHQGPARARNTGTDLAKGNIIVFTDDDCVPLKNWLITITAPFLDKEIVGVKGAYCTEQKNLIARFVQYEYEEKYRMLSRHQYIDFIDTYSAAFRKDIFLKEGGFSGKFLDAAGEDADFSYRLYKKGYKMVFEPNAKVWHTHPDKLSIYMKKKLLYGCWHMLALKNNPDRIIKDTYRPQLMKVQILMPGLLTAVSLGVLLGILPSYIVAEVIGLFVLTTTPFVRSVFTKDRQVALWAPFFLFCRSCAQLCGILAGIVALVASHQSNQSNKNCALY
jgi:glycosyltransferase involved in cell wall biosynthesis